MVCLISVLNPVFPGESYRRDGRVHCDGKAASFSSISQAMPDCVAVVADGRYRDAYEPKQGELCVNWGLWRGSYRFWCTVARS